jgi:hypothetical protein
MELRSDNNDVSGHAGTEDGHDAGVLLMTPVLRHHTSELTNSAIHSSSEHSFTCKITLINTMWIG